MSVAENLRLGRPGATDERTDGAGDRDRRRAVRLRPAVRAGHPHRRAGHEPVRWSAATAFAGPRHPGGAEDPGARRHPVRPRRAHRSRRHRGVAPGAARGAPASSSPTARRPCCWPTRSRCSTPSTARHHHPHRHPRRTAGHRPAVPLPAGRRRRTRRRRERACAWQDDEHRSRLGQCLRGGLRERWNPPRRTADLRRLGRPRRR